MSGPDQTHLSPPALAELLAYCLEAGVDMALDGAPHDRFAEYAQAQAVRAAEAPPAPERAPNAPAPARMRPAVGAPADPREAELTARAAAAAAGSLAELRAALEGFEGCALKATATRLVFADGNPEAKIMLVGEAPGGDEDRIGKPFVGRAGQLLDRMLEAIHLDRTKVYIANIVPWRPPGNRDPSPAEVAACLPFLKRQIELINPTLLICLGRFAAEQLLGVTGGITRARGQWRDYDCAGRAVRAMPMLHPAFLLRQPAQKRLAWRDLLEVERALGADAL